MADEEEEGHGKKGKEKPKKKKSNMVPAIVVALGMVVGGKMMGSSKAAPATAASALAAAGGVAAKDEPMNCTNDDILHPKTEGSAIKLDPQTLNLANGAYAKITISLQLSKSVVLETFKAEGEGEKALDVVLATISGRDKAEFASPQAMATLKEKLTDEIRPKFQCEVLDVLISQWVVQ